MDKEIIVILDNIRSALNVGAIFRTADGVGVKKIYLCGISPYPGHSKLHKTALDAENYVEWKHFKSTEDAIKSAKEEGYTIYSVEQTQNSKRYHEVVYSNKTCVIFGHEITGVSPNIIQQSDYAVELPMLGKKNSLNVATTAGIILYHIRFN